MNITAINTLATLLENLPAESAVGFNMSTYIAPTDEDHEDFVEEYQPHVEYNCGTVACIAGWGALYLRADGKGLLKLPRTYREVDHHGPQIATRILDLDDSTSRRLFEPMNSILGMQDIEWGDVTPKQAASVLRNLAETGEVDWSTALTS